MNKQPELSNFIPEWRPKNPSRWDDEFDGYTVNGKWTRMMYPAGTSFDDFPNLVENVKQSALSLENVAPTDATINYRRYYQPAPSAPWRIQGEFELYTSVTSGLPGCGLSVVGNGTTTQEILLQNNINKQILIQNVTTSTGANLSNIASVSFGSTNAAYVAGLNRIRFQIRYDGTTLFFDRAIGGTHFSGYTNWTSVAAATNGIGNIGFLLTNRSSINWFRVKTDSAKYMIDID